MTEKQRQLTPADFMGDDLSPVTSKWAFGDMLDIRINGATVVEVNTGQGLTVAWRGKGKVYEARLPSGASIVYRR